MQDPHGVVPEEIQQCVHDVFAQDFQSRSGTPAICSWDGEMSYGELDEVSTSLAGLLVNLGIKPEDIVPLCFEKSMWTVVAMLAVLKAGGAFVPLDPEHPAGRQEEIFKQTGAKVVLTSAQSSTLWESLPCNVVLVSKASIGQLPLSNEIRSTVTPRNAAYIIFTSGSTGVPKGVVLEHQTVITSCLGHGKAFGFTKNTRMLQFASYTFDACIAEILTTLLHGGCVCIPSEHGRCNDLAISIKSMDVNWALLTPTVARLLDPSTVSLKALVFIGEQVSTTDTERWGDIQLINGYGPTECCVFCTAHVGANGFQTGNIGKSIASVGWVVDPENHNKLAPLGSVGELLIEGPILARGYLNDQAKTDAAFIEDPTWLVEGGGGHPGRRGRLYKTGDLVRYDADGNLIYVGRKDGQVKVRGQRVELGEIEHHVQECMPKAQQVAVEIILSAEEPDSAMLAAFLKLDEGLYNTHLTRNAIGDGSIVHLPLAEVEEKLAERLPKHMVPTVFFALRKLPMTASGKTDRKQLQEIGASFSAQQLAEIRTTRQNLKRCPSTNMELALRQLWAKVLHVEVETIGLDDSFFRLGGDSIAAMKLVAEARRNGMELSVANIFQNSTLKALAMLGSKDTRNFRNEIESFSILGPGVNVANVREEVASICNIDVGMVEDIYPCSPVQEGMISLTLRRSGDYVMRSVLELQDNVDQSGFQAAWEQVARSIPTLRTRIVQHSSLGLLQAVIEENIRWMNEEGLEDYLQLDKAISMDLGEPLVRYALVKEPQRDKLWFVWTVHHALYDGWSLPRILDAVRTVYTGGVLEPLPKFNVFIEHISQQDPEAMKAYWQESLAEHRTTPFPLVPADIYQWNGRVSVRSDPKDGLEYHSVNTHSRRMGHSC
ncbi:hypothetical protein B0J11DRAFT_598956 [Dendryphion nanum]|uniref:Nonribosomal peptide synthetase 13 n=1 Tax=Dendryphion nanum TaxID=256645 RepID=A0A9P9D1S7_9PLEO|nr:hypothetical protein B0J11DRAFT_598956 [Dendryphion nanum]